MKKGMHIKRWVKCLSSLSKSLRWCSLDDHGEINFGRFSKHLMPAVCSLFVGLIFTQTYSTAYCFVAKSLGLMRTYSRWSQRPGDVGFSFQSSTSPNLIHASKVAFSYSNSSELNGEVMGWSELRSGSSHKFSSLSGCGKTHRMKKFQEWRFLTCQRFFRKE